MTESPADTIRRAATLICEDTTRLIPSGERTFGHALADLFDAIAAEAEAALVFTGIDPRAVESAPVWAAAIKAARAYLGETPDAAYVAGIIERSARLDQ